MSLPSKMPRKYKIKGVNEDQRQWLWDYERNTGFEPMFLEDLKSGVKTFNTAAEENIDWYEMHMHDAFQRISDHIPE